MRKCQSIIIPLFITIFVLLFVPSQKVSSQTITSPNIPGTWSLAFDDEFNGTSLDTTKWAPDWYNKGVMNNVVTDAANVSVSGGNLILTLASANSGALINTQSNNGFKVKVGMFAESRIYFPGNGTKLYNWPAWWISGASWPSAGENDIAEVLSGSLTVNYHSPSGSHNQGSVSGYWGEAFHTYGILRKATSAEVYWDGNLVKSYPTDDNGLGEDLILNVGYNSSYTTTFGVASQVKVDYVRVWQDSGTTKPIGCNGDYDKNGTVNISDFATFGQNYKKTGLNCALDIVGGDCLLNISDFAEFSKIYKVTNACI